MKQERNKQIVSHTCGKGLPVEFAQNSVPFLMFHNLQYYIKLEKHVKQGKGGKELPIW